MSANRIITLGGTIAAVCSRCQSRRNYEFATHRLNREFVKAAHTPELIAKLTENGNIVASSTPQEMSRLVANEVKNMEQLIKALGLKAQ